MPEDDRSGADAGPAGGGGGGGGEEKVRSFKDLASRRKRAAQRDRPMVSNAKKFLVWGAVVLGAMALVVLLWMI